MRSFQETLQIIRRIEMHPVFQYISLHFEESMVTKLQSFKVVAKGPRHTDLLFLVFQEERPSPCGATVGYLYQQVSYFMIGKYKCQICSIFAATKVPYLQRKEKVYLGLHIHKSLWMTQQPNLDHAMFSIYVVEQRKKSVQTV